MSNPLNCNLDPLIPRSKDEDLTGSITHILAIETSCDETAIAILERKNGSLNLLANEISSQVKLHASFGGVVPNLAAREHAKNIVPLFNAALTKAKLKIKDIDLLAVTHGPGLIPALLVGVNFAKTLAYKHHKPLLGIHHIEGHIYANFISDKISVISNFQFPISKQFPILCLVVSGGHTQLILMRDHFQYEIIGQTLDDAAGEAFDKVARILNIGYPGGPSVAHWATKFKISNLKFQIKLPRPMLNKKNFDFSFSGLKTAVLYETKKQPELLENPAYVAEVCHEFQQAVVDVLVAKTIRAAKEYAAATIMLAGGVSANQELRKQLGEAIASQLPTIDYCLPEISLTGDNAAMIATAAALRWNKMTADQKAAARENWKSLQAYANLTLS